MREIDRRKFVSGVSVATLLGVAGCLGGGGGDSTPTDEETATEEDTPTAEETSTDEETATEEDTPTAEETPAGGETSTEGETTVEETIATTEEMPAEGTTSAEEGTSAEDGTSTSTGDNGSASNLTALPSDIDPTDPSTFPEFDATDPQFPQLTSTLLEAGYETGSLKDLKRMQENSRDEPRYGSPVAKTPDDESKLLNPDTLQFSLVPTEDPTVYENTLSPLIENIEEETGKNVEYATLDSYAAQVEAMRSERLHIAGFSTGTVPFAVNIADAVPFSVQIDGSGGENEGQFGYRLWLIAPLDSDIGSLLSLKGDPKENVAHADPSSNSGNLAPRALFGNLGVAPEEDYAVSYSGGHQQSSLGVANGDYAAAPVCSTCYGRVARDDQLDPSKIKCVWASEPFPTTAFSYVNTLHPDIQEGVRTAFLDNDYQDTSIADEFEGRGTWVEIDYATVWDIILQIQESLDTEYKTGNIGE